LLQHPRQRGFQKYASESAAADRVAQAIDGQMRGVKGKVVKMPKRAG